MARYFSSVQGRFTTPDSFGGIRTSPQTLNLYSYVKNNPLKYVDPTGHFAQNPKKKKEAEPEEIGFVEEIVTTELTPLNKPDHRTFTRNLNALAFDYFRLGTPFAGDVIWRAVGRQVPFIQRHYDELHSDHTMGAIMSIPMVGMVEAGAIKAEAAAGEMDLLLGGAGKTIGLGLDADLANLAGSGAIIYKDAGWQRAGLTSVNWGKVIMEESWFKISFGEASQNASAIRFDVSSFSPTYSNPRLTSWEFNRVVNNPALLGKTTFMQNGSQVIWNGTTFVKP